MKRLLVLAMVATLGLTVTGCGLFEFSYVNPVTGEALDDDDDDDDDYDDDYEDEIERRFNEIEDEEDLEELFEEAEKKMKEDYENDDEYDDYDEYDDEYEDADASGEGSVKSIALLGKGATGWNVVNNNGKYTAESENLEVGDTYVAATLYDRGDHLEIFQDNTPGYDCIVYEVYDYGTVENMEKVLDKAIDKFGDYEQGRFCGFYSEYGDIDTIVFYENDKEIEFIVGTPIVITRGWYIPENSGGKMGDVEMADYCIEGAIQLKD